MRASLAWLGRAAAPRPGRRFALGLADALRLMQVRDEVAAVNRQRFEDALDRGYDDVSAGRVIEFKTEDEIDALFARL